MKLYCRKLWVKKELRYALYGVDKNGLFTMLELFPVGASWWAAVQYVAANFPDEVFIDLDGMTYIIQDLIAGKGVANCEDL